MNEEEVREFLASFRNYVREDDDGGVTDTRDQLVRKIANGTPAAVTFMERWDVAALLTGTVMVSDKKSLLQVRDCEPEQRRELIGTVLSEGKPPLEHPVGHPVRYILDALTKTDEGAQIYAFTCAAMLWASNSSITRPYLMRRSS